ncbi:hypothetical protein DFH06DRAFT_529315 [Mycena polygramma]|nr:hypothetical protein DFH06DRAFT_529315 [Mycena polygramma]
MHVQFLPEPPVPQSGTAWIENGLTLRYGPFQPVEAPLPANAAEQGAFECDSVLWNLWVEFHQTMRPDFSFPPLESTPTPRLVKHLSDSMTRCLAFHDFWRRLTGHLDLTGVIALPRNASFSEQWVFVSTSLRDQWPSPAMDGAMHQRKLWMCMIYELTLFHFNLKTRQAELNGLFIGNISHFFQSLGHKGECLPRFAFDIFSTLCSQ